MEDIEELPTVTRETTARHLCRCVLVWPALSTDEGPQLNECQEWVASSDQPFCGLCESRHPDVPPPIQVSAIALRGEIT